MKRVGGERGSRSVSTTAMTVAALGVVFGDIGTSPLYSVREAFEGHDIEVTRTTAFGACSLVFWSLIVVICIKYLALVLRADSKGEGGILVLASLVAPMRHRIEQPILGIVAFVGVFGTALLYGDGVITPAISVLSAVEGLKVATSALDAFVVPIACVILVGLFAIQRRGTGTVGRIFGPITLLWFVILALLGINQIVRAPEVIQAVNPIWALRYFSEGGIDAFLSLGSIFLVVTGGEALYADMGHFGKKPIRYGWFSVVFPALVIVYFGQAALLVRDPEAIRSPLFLMGPSWTVIPLTLMATIATVIASQALISGVFSLTVQAVQLDYMPRVRILHTSADHRGQVYVPIANWALMIGCVGLVIGFQTSSNLAAAYGLAVTMTMAITSLLLGAVAFRVWKWKRWVSLTMTGLLLCVDLPFLIANLAKIPYGGWFALVVGGLLLLLMTTWKRGRQLVAERMHRGEVPIADYLASIDRTHLVRPSGTAVYLFRTIHATPPAMIANVTHNRVLHQQVCLLAIDVREAPTIGSEERWRVTELGEGLYQVTLRFGFMEQIDVPLALAQIDHEGLDFDPATTSFFLGRETVVSVPDSGGMAPWRERMFAFMNRSASSAARFFNLPSDRVFEVGAQVEI